MVDAMLSENSDDTNVAVSAPKYLLGEEWRRSDRGGEVQTAEYDIWTQRLQCHTLR